MPDSPPPAPKIREVELRRHRSPVTARRKSPSTWKPSPSPPPPPRHSPIIRDRSPSPPSIRTRSPPSSGKRKRSASPEPVRKRAKSRSYSPIPENGAGDSLSIEETNRLRAKLGLKPLEVGPSNGGSSITNDDSRRNDDNKDNLPIIKDDWGEHYHKPAENLAEKAKAEKVREKLKERKEKRAVEAKLAKIKTLAESDSEDDTKKWVEKQKQADQLKKEAAHRAKMFEEMDEEFSLGNLVEKETKKTRQRAYKDANLKGLRVEHDLNDFKEGRDTILTLKDHGVLDEDDDVLVNVNMLDDERYKKSNLNKKKNINSYGYDVYEEEVDEFGDPIGRSLLSKYDEEIGSQKKSSFVIGDNAEEEAKRRRKLLEMKAKLNNKRLETLDTIPLTLASEYYTPDELTTFKKPKKKVKKLRQKLKADDLLTIAGDHNPSKDLGSRRRPVVDTDDLRELNEDLSDVKVEVDDDLEQVLSKARRLKQKENIIQKTLPIDPMEIVKQEIKEEEDNGNAVELSGLLGSNIILNETAEFCRTLGDIPTYGLAGNRDNDAAEIMDFEQDLDRDIQDPSTLRRGTWVSDPVDVDENDESNDAVVEIKDTAILDEEPDVAGSMAGALKLAMSKGYIEKEEKNRPSNARYAHLQAQNYSIDDKAHDGDDKYSRRDRYSGPLSDFKEKEGFKPNVKLEYIDDSGRMLNAKEAFRYLSHKFHGKGPGKNKIEKRLKKQEQETVSCLPFK